VTPPQIETWRNAIASFRQLLIDIDDWGVSSPCPGWSLADLVSHTIDLEAMLAADPRPAHTPDWAVHTHIDSDFGRMTELGVDYRRGWSRDDLLADLDETHARALARVESLGPDASIPWLRGDTPVAQLLGMRTFDIWMHEQDARVATGRIGALDVPAASNAMHYLTAGLPKIWGRSVSAPIGSVLHVKINEPGLAGECWVRVNEDGKASLHEAQEADVNITLPWLAFVMLAGGRSTETNFAESVVVVGDQALGQAFIAAMAVTP
jgi:uncharacterized protein (TIGR03083 family)